MGYNESEESPSGFMGSNLNPDFKDSRSMCFFGKGFEKSALAQRLFFTVKIQVRIRHLSMLSIRKYKLINYK